MKILTQKALRLFNEKSWAELNYDGNISVYYKAFFNDLLGGETGIPKYDGLFLKDWTITRESDAEKEGGFRLTFSFTVTGNSLPQTLPHGRYTKVLEDTIKPYIWDDEIPSHTEEGFKSATDKLMNLDKYGEYEAVQMLCKYFNTARSSTKAIILRSDSDDPHIVSRIEAQHKKYVSGRSDAHFCCNNPPNL